MNKSLLAVPLLGSLLAGQLLAQSGAVIPQGGAGHAKQASCVILKRMGPADEVTSRLYSFGLRGKQFQYVEGKLPDGFPFHGRLTDHDVRNLQGRGAEVLILNQDFTSEELKEARDDCRGETGKAPNLAEPKSAPPSTSTPAATGSVLTAAPSAPAAGLASVLIKSTPDGADISIDGKFVGNTPSTLQLAPGDHLVTIEKSGYKAWQRTITLTAGASPTINPTLEKQGGGQNDATTPGGNGPGVSTETTASGQAATTAETPATVNCRGTHGLALFAEPTAQTIIGTFACGESLSVLKTGAGPQSQMAEVLSTQGRHGYVNQGFLDLSTPGK